MQKYKTIYALLVVLLVGLPAVAIAAPAEVKGVIAAQKPYGTARVSTLGLTIYDAALWTDAKKWSPAVTYALSLTYGISVKSRDLVDRTLSEMHDQQPLTAQQRAQYHQQLTALFPAVAKGDRITALYRPDRGLWLYHNGALRGRLTDTVMARHFMDIWLSERTSQPVARADLLRLPRPARKAHIRLE